MIKIGLVGVGYWGPNIVRSFELTRKATVSWLCDLNPDNLSRIADRYPQAKPTQNFEDILNDKTVDAVAISTPAGAHYEIAHRALSAGKHVLIEKPITVDSQQAIHLMDLAEQVDRVLMVGHVFEYNFTIRALKDLIDSGELGDIHYLNFVRTNLGPVRTDVSALWDLAAHDVSIMCYLMDACPTDVTARGQSYLNENVEDAVFATFSFKKGIMAHVNASWLNPRKVRKIVVVGSKKMAVWDDLNLSEPIHIYDKRIAALDEIPDTFMDYKTKVVEGGVYIPHIRQNQPLQTECEHFIECIELGLKPISGGYSGLRVVLALEAATASMKKRSRIVSIKMPAQTNRRREKAAPGDTDLLERITEKVQDKLNNTIK